MYKSQRRFLSFYLSILTFSTQFNAKYSKNFSASRICNISIHKYVQKSEKILELRAPCKMLWRFYLVLKQKKGRNLSYFCFGRGRALELLAKIFSLSWNLDKQALISIEFHTSISLLNQIMNISNIEHNQQRTKYLQFYWSMKIQFVAYQKAAYFSSNLIVCQQKIAMIFDIFSLLRL